MALKKKEKEKALNNKQNVCIHAEKGISAEAESEKSRKVHWQGTEIR